MDAASSATSHATAQRQIASSPWEEEEVRLFRRTCDEANALPCRVCGINVCEVCRDCPRFVPEPDYIAQFTHLPVYAPQLGDVMCLCPGCDDAMEDQLRGQFLNALCDCDHHRRWVCWKCCKAEHEEMFEYQSKHMMGETDIEFGELVMRTKVLPDQVYPVLFLCTCGATVPEETTPRCLYCKRRHRPGGEWHGEATKLNGTLPPYVDNDGCLPWYSYDRYSKGKPWQGYPRLGYQGPIYRSTDETDGRASEGSGQTTATTLILRSTQAAQGAATEWRS